MKKKKKRNLLGPLFFEAGIEKKEPENRTEFRPMKPKDFPVPQEAAVTLAIFDTSRMAPVQGKMIQSFYD